ncbi:MAG: divalent-cation tolerance protein CutA [Candidatus Omnitrophica bacterium]|nr:divalent-cation tolerance protein CutA [Candidatus Omnitrophota bacterium]
MACLVVFSTAPSLSVARQIVRALVQERLAACVNIIPSVESHYRWKGKITKDREVLMVMKTRKGLFTRLEKRLKHLHPYEVPEILALPAVKGSRSYLSWMNLELK